MPFVVDNQQFLRFEGMRQLCTSRRFAPLSSDKPMQLLQFTPVHASNILPSILDQLRASNALIPKVEWLFDQLSIEHMPEQS